MRVLAALLCLALVVQADPEAKLREKVAKVWIDYARWLKVQGAKEEAQRALAEARLAEPAARDLERLAAEVEGMEAKEGEVAGLGKRREKAHRDAAKLFDRLSKLKHPPEEDERFDDFLWKAVELDPSRARIGKILSRIRQNAGNQAKAAVAGRMLVRLRDVAPEGDYDSLETDLARSDVALIKHPEHPMVGWLSLPKGWKRNVEWPVLVGVDGAGSNFLGAARGFAKTRGSRKFIVLAPCSLSNTNALDAKRYPFYSEQTRQEGDRDRIGFDLAGLEALLKVVSERYGGAAKVGITGFSGGGNLCYGWTARHPDRVLFAAPACANFSGLGFREAAPVENGGPPIHIMTGEKDKHRDFTHGNKDMPGIEPQTDNAVAALERLGFTNVRRSMLPGVGHSSCHRQVWEFADEMMK